MPDYKHIVENLSLFNNRTFTRKQWDLILKACGCPQSAQFWQALRTNNLERYKLAYTLVDLNEESFNKVIEEYLEAARTSMRKSKAKAVAKAKARACKGVTLYMVDGVLTTERPNRMV